MEQLDEQSKLRKYILNDISDEERFAIEERLLTDDRFFEEVSMAEEYLIQDYADEKLTAGERERFEKHFLTSEENRQKVKFARALRKYIDESGDLPETEKKPNFFDSLKAFFSAPVTVGLAVLAIAAIAGFFVWKNASADSEVLIALNKFQKNNRPTEARITGFDYAPKIEGTRGGDKDENLYLISARSRAAEAVLKNESAENLHQLGLVYLAENNPDEAIKQFEKALKKNPDIAKLHNDLAVALMEKGSLESLAKAKDEVEKAIELDKGLTEAYFNRALVSELLNLPNQAGEAWENYLKLDSSSRWANEAREHLQRLETDKPVSQTKEEVLQDFLEAQKTQNKEKAWEILSRNRGLSSGKLVQQQLAFLFVESKTTADETKAKEALDALLYAGNLEKEKSGELFWLDLAKYYRDVSKDKIPPLKLAQDRYLQTVLNREATIRKGDYKKSITELEQAQVLYLKAGNRLEPKLIDFLIGYLINRDTKILESNKKLEELAEFSRKASYKWLEAQAVTWLGVNDLSSRKLSQAFLKTQKALDLSKETEDLLGQQKNFAQISEIYFLMGQFDNAFDNIQKNLELGKLPEASANERWRALNYIARCFFKLKQYNSTLIFEKEALDLASQLGDKTFEFTSLVDLGVTYSALGDFDSALRLIEKGKAVSESFTDRDYKNKCTAHTNLQLGHLKRQKRLFSEAREYYQKAAGYYDSGDFQVYSYDAHRGILLSSLAENNDYEFQTELPKILDIFKNYRAEILEEQNRNSFFDNEQDIYDIAVEYEFGKANFAKAFDYAEESRSRSLLDLQNSAVQISTDEKQPGIKFTNLSEPLELTQVQTEMPENAELLLYTVLPEKVLIWVVAKDRLNTAQVEIPAEKLEEKVTDYLQLISKNEEPEEQLSLSKDLHQILIAPVKNYLDVNKQLFIIPDKILFRLPFATLYSEKYLIEEYEISYSPSANVFLNCSKKAKEFLEKPAENLLSVGNPAFNPAAYENALQPLPSAKSEAEAAAQPYQESRILTEKSATKASFKDYLMNADVVHFAGHYVVDEKTPLLSSLVLAGDKKEESNLTNYEIIGEKLSHIRLIVLSACDTGIEKYYRGEGMIGASRTFLAVKVPLVVASQWSVDSEAAKQLMVRFHQLRKTGRLSTAEALRQSQLEMLRTERFNQPYYWAAFFALGGYTQF